MASRVRAFFLWMAPIFIVLAAGGVLATAGIVVASTASQNRHDREHRDELIRIAEEANAIAEVNTQILAEIRPCLTDDPADSPACVRQAESEQRLRDAIGQIQTQHDDMLAKLESLLSRPIARNASVRSTRSTSPMLMAPPATTRPVAPSPSPPPAPTTTCPQAGNSGRCR